MDNRERARERDKSQRRPISLEEKQKHFIAAVGKRGNASCHQLKVKVSGREKKVNRNTYNISSIKRGTGKFLKVSRCIRSKQRQRNVLKKRRKKKCAARAKYFFWLIKPTDFLWLFSFTICLVNYRF